MEKVARERAAEKEQQQAEEASLRANRKTMQVDVDDRFNAARRAGRMMVQHPTTGKGMSEQDFKDEVAKRHALKPRPSAFEFWSVPLPGVVLEPEVQPPKPDHLTLVYSAPNAPVEPVVEESVDLPQAADVQ